MMKFIGTFLISLMVAACMGVTITAIILSPVIKIVKFISVIFIFILFNLVLNILED